MLSLYDLELCPNERHRLSIIVRKKSNHTVLQLGCELEILQFYHVNYTQYA